MLSPATLVFSFVAEFRDIDNSLPSEVVNAHHLIHLKTDSTDSGLTKTSYTTGMLN